MTVVFPPPEGELVRILAAAGITASTTVPQTVPARFVLIRASGGSKRGPALSQRLVQLLAYAAPTAAAARLAEDAIAAIVAAPCQPGEQVVRGASVVGEPSHYPDPDDNSPRYTATVALLLRGTVTP